MTTTAALDPVVAAEKLVAKLHAEHRDFEATKKQADTTLEGAVVAETVAAERGASDSELTRLAAARRGAEDRARWAQSKEAGGAKRLKTAREELEEAETRASYDHEANIAGQFIKVDRDIDRHRSGLGRGLQRRLDLADEWIMARQGKVGGPSIRQVRGTVHLLAIALAPLDRLFPSDLPRVHPAFRETTLAAYERKLFARWLGNGVAANTNEIKED